MIGDVRVIDEPLALPVISGLVLLVLLLVSSHVLFDGGVDHIVLEHRGVQILRDYQLGRVVNFACLENVVISRGVVCAGL